MATTAVEHAHADVHAHGSKTGLWSWITTVDHKRIGILYGATAFVFFLMGGIEALLLRIQLGRPDNTFLSPEMYNQLFTMHGTTMIFLAIMPLSAMFFNYMIPLLIGARDVAFPRLNAFSYWVFLLGGLFLNSGFLFGAAPNQGWFGYANLTSNQYSPGLNVDFWMIGLQILGIASLAAGVNFFVTVLNLRAPGMKLMRMPMFVWMSFITQVLILLAFPVITVALILLMFDRFFGSHFYVPSAGGDPLLWQHLFWIFGHPEVYILILPSFGIVSEILPVFSRKPLFGYAAMVFSGAFIAFLGFGVWSHHMFSTGMGPIADTVFSLSTMLIAIPTGVKIFNWIGTMWGGSLQMKTPLYFCLGFIAMFIMGGLSGVMHASPPADLQQTDTYFVVAHFHYVLFGGSIFALTAGAYYWWPKMFGRMLSESLGKLHFWLMLIGFNLTFFPMHFVGLLGMPRRVYTYPKGLGFEIYNQVETAGAFLLLIAFLVFIWNVIRTTRGPANAPADPWNGATLEWAIPSPPQEFNFAEVPVVHSRDPLWETKRERGGQLPEPVRVSGAGIHMPHPSYWPAVAAIGVAAVFVALMMLPKLGPAGVVVAVAILFLGVFKWAFEPA
ncbi:MAG TPA: cytochrome c oxidase subunit I [Gemmatimonadales bacterium]|jgi:cytochrome c oxidase subunit 1|nr:cytochrome c oxidase subunit I [Gemmatimonadales bacterium]